VDLGALRFNQEPDPSGVEWWLSDLVGWDSPTLRDDLEDRALAHGASRGRSFYGVRELTVSGTLVSNNGPAALQVALDVLAYETDLTDQDALLVVHEDPVKQMAVRRSGMPRQNWLSDSAAQFELDLTAADPRKYSAAERTLTLHPGDVDLAQNGGTFRSGAPLQIGLAGPLYLPQLTIAGQLIEFLTIPSPLVLTIDTDSGAVTAQDGTTAFRYVISTGGFPTLPARASSEVRLGGAGSGAAVLAWRDAWI
jgi:hypothetical protein